MIDICLFTNGSTSFEYALRSVQAQTVKTNIHIIENLSISEGIKKCLELCQSEYFMKVDDDMFLHPRTIEFFIKSIPLYEKKNHTRKRRNLSICRQGRRHSQKVDMWGSCLWEFWKGGVGLKHSIKAYRHSTASKHDWRTDARGKVDKVFLKYLNHNNGIGNIDYSIVAVHALRDVESQKLYRDIWVQNSASDSARELSKLDSDQVKIFRDVPSYDDQYQKLDLLPALNRRRKTSFGAMLCG